MSRRGVPADGFATGRPCYATQPIRPASTFWAAAMGAELEYGGGW
jgi:hypothetical protein